MDDVEALLCEKLIALGSQIDPAEVASIGKEHGLSMVPTIRLVLRVCGVSFSEAVAVAARVHHNLSLEEYEAQSSGGAGRT